MLTLLSAAVLFAALLAGVAHADSILKDAWVADGLELRQFRSGMEEPRGLFALPDGDLLVLQRKQGSENIAVCWMIMETVRQTTAKGCTFLQEMRITVCCAQGFRLRVFGHYSVRWP